MDKAVRRYEVVRHRRLAVIHVRKDADVADAFLCASKGWVEQPEAQVEWKGLVVHYAGGYEMRSVRQNSAQALDSACVGLFLRQRPSGRTHAREGGMV
jgi:hypothetical protein